MRKTKGLNLIKQFVFYGVFVAFLLCLRSSVFASYVVPTGSMNPTILEGDFFFTNKLAYRLKIPYTKVTIFKWAEPERGDIIVFKFPGEKEKLFTKRVLGVPGDIIEFREKSLYINGERIERKYTGRSSEYDRFEEDLFGKKYRVQYAPYLMVGDDMRRVVIPEGKLFVAGDNRDNSYDSRFWGLLPLENVEGEIFLRWFSWDKKEHRPRLDRIDLM